MYTVSMYFLFFFFLLILLCHFSHTASFCCSLQVRDEYRQDYDPARGGYGKLAQIQRGPDGQHKF